MELIVINVMRIRNNRTIWEHAAAGQTVYSPKMLTRAIADMAKQKEVQQRCRPTGRVNDHSWSW